MNHWKLESRSLATQGRYTIGPPPFARRASLTTAVARPSRLVAPLTKQILTGASSKCCGAFDRPKLEFKILAVVNTVAADEYTMTHIS